MRSLVLGTVGVSLALHTALFLGLRALPRESVKHEISVAMFTEKPKKAEKREPPNKEEPPRSPAAKPPPAPRPTVLPRPANDPPPTAEPPPSSDKPSQAMQALPNLGDMNVGGPGGLGVGGPRGSAPSATPSATAPVEKVLSKRPVAATGADCAEPVSKPKPIGAVPQPAFTEDALASKIAGKVFVKVTVDASGNVTDATVTRSLGHGLDERCVAIARGVHFSPAQRCGRPTASTFIFFWRFAAQDP
ncbi:MAG: energy transducer TonB [Polyangiales bacterium]